MNYLRVYFSIVDRAKKRVLTEYGEKHHIIPVSIFSDSAAKILDKWEIDSQESEKNLTKLTAKEHYICHLLLVRIFENDKNCYERMLFAANFMASRTKSGRGYDWLKKEFSKHMSQMLTGKPSRAKGTKWSDEQKRNKSIRNPLSGKTYEEVYGKVKAKKLKQSRRLSRLGKKNSYETRLKLSNRVITDEWKEKISQSNKGKKRSVETISRMSARMSDPNKNTHVDQTLYRFYHIDGRVIVARRYDMKKVHGCNKIHKLLRGEQLTCNGWSYKGEIISI